MKFIVKKTKSLTGTAEIPGSKSHTIRAIVIASLAQGQSKIFKPLESEDTMAAVNACKCLGAEINTEKKYWTIKGFSGTPLIPSSGYLDLKNSGTSFNLICGVVSLGHFEVILDGDNSLRSRPVEPLLTALRNIGAQAVSINGNGKPPVKIKGRIKGGETTVDGINSQFLSSLLISSPLADNNTEITAVNLHEKPYVKMTLRWLDEQKIHYEKNEDLSHFIVWGNQSYRPFKKRIPGDWSSATFPLVAAAITKSEILIKGLDLNDDQGDKKVIDYLRNAGAVINNSPEGIRIKGDMLKGLEIDLNETPDALPALSVMGCMAEGITVLKNVQQARIKETDRISVMSEELTKMGADIKEMEDGLIIRKSNLKGTTVDGHKDHRVVMALTLAGLIAEGTTIITTAESVSVTFPGFLEMMKNLGANIEVVKE
ncbi:MAG TPA: 3-phosphoshikimate 1-carboxyvinyltransferase [Candidatus Ratteibacteria bacterium]|nr:3-phosphoshikimate 1-carboxyvinyltransferase [bacterium]HRS05832.1 3-phosphoshikimate 1-carboxyvinyltransferase [Candidatus Ratteibacteria bacterium]